jgi:hypothetical protein
VRVGESAIAVIWLQCGDGLLDQRSLVRNHRLELDGVSRERRLIARHRDHQRVPGERGEALVRRVTVACRAKRQHLPDGDAGGGEKIEKAHCVTAELPDSVRAGKRRGVQENSRCAGKRHGRGSE